MPRWKRVIVTGMALIGAALLWALVTLPPVQPSHNEMLREKVGVGATPAEVERILGPPQILDDCAAVDGGGISTRLYQGSVTVDFYAPPGGKGALRATQVY